MIAFYQTVAHSRLARDRHPTLAQRRHVAIDRAHADLEMLGQLIRFHQAPPLHKHHHRHEPVRSIHPEGIALNKAHGQTVSGLIGCIPSPRAL